jgi:hypothetical protein
MSNPLLSILIPTVVGREDQFERLIQRLLKFCGEHWELGNIEIKSDKDSKEMTIGEKRERLYQRATGLYSVQWDDDDDIADGGLNKIISALKENPNVDCCSYEEYVNIDGNEYRSNHSNSYADWNGDGNGVFPDGFHFQRTIFFKDVIKTEVAKKVPVEHCRFGEDHLFARALKPHIYTEVHIPEQIYRYIHISSNFNERYGLDRES